MKKVMVLLLVSSLLSSCIKDEPFKIPYNGYLPEELNDGWLTGSPGEVGMDEEIINEVYQTFFSEDHLDLARSLLIVKDGKLVAEGYCRSIDDRDKISNIKSATKSITSLLTGIALDKGYLDSVNQKLFTIIPSYFDDDLSKRSITIYHALTMQTGLEWDNDKDTRPLITGAESSSLEMVLHKPLESTPGSTFHYTDGNPQLISGIITERSGQSEEAFAVSNLFSKMNITDFYWEKHPDGLNFGAVALYLKPRDFAKFGLLCVQDGNWSGEQLVPSSWIGLSTQIHSQADDQHPYGFYWWIRPAYEAYVANGHGGQYIYVIPGKNLAIIMTSDPYAGQYDGEDNLDEFEELIVKKVLESL